MKKTLALAIGASLFAAAVFADAVPTNVYTVTVSAGTLGSPAQLDVQTVEVYDATTKETTTRPMSEVSFAANSIFRKKGAGYMVSSLALKDFTGEIRVEEGAMIVNTNRQVGATHDPATAPRIVVSDGASFVLAATKATCAKHALVFRNEFHLAGAGADGNGALCANNAENQQGKCLQGPIVLEADADIGTRTVARFDCGGDNFRLVLNGHRLTIKNAGKAGICCLGNATVAEAGATGGLVVSGATLRLHDGIVWDGSSDNLLDVTGGTLVLYDYRTADIPWTLKTRPGTILVDSAQPFSFGATMTNAYSGPLDLAGSLTVKADSADRGLTVGGKVSGSGSIAVQNAWLQLANAENDFTGNIGVAGSTFAAGLGVLENGAVPVAGKITLSDARLALAQKEIDLPALNFTVPDGKTQSFDGGTDGKTASLLKAGTGTLDVTAPQNVTGRVDVIEGTLKLRKSNSGLVCGHVFCGATAAENAALGLGSYTVANLIRYSSLRPTNRVDFALNAFNTADDDIWVAKTAEEQACGGYVMVTYKGYVWNRSGEKQTWTFAGGGGTHLRLAVNASGMNAFVYYNNKIGVTCNFELNPGPNLLQLTSYSAVGSVTPRGASFTNMYWKSPAGGGMGVMVDRQGRGSTDCSDYEYLVDPGDGSVLTQTDGDDAALDVGLRFSHLKLGVQGILDLGGNKVVCETLYGHGTVTNGNDCFDAGLTVRKKWTISDAYLNAGGCLLVNGILSFSDGCTFEIENLSELPHAKDPIAIVRSTEGIVGLPTASFPERESVLWKVTKSDDGKSLLLTYHPQGLMLIFR